MPKLNKDDELRLPEKPQLKIVAAGPAGQLVGVADKHTASYFDPREVVGISNVVGGRDQMGNTGFGGIHGTTFITLRNGGSITLLGLTAAEVLAQLAALPTLGPTTRSPYVI